MNKFERGLSIFTFILGISLLLVILFMACSPVTDAVPETEEVETRLTNGDDMDPIIRRPPSGGTYYD